MPEEKGYEVWKGASRRYGEYEEELKQREILSDKQKKELIQERKKNKDIERELREYEDSVMSGIVPKAAISRKSPDSSPEVPKPKRIRTEVINVDSDKKVTTLSTSMTTAYTATPRDDANLKVMTKDPLSIRPLSHQSAEQTMGGLWTYLDKSISILLASTGLE